MILQKLQNCALRHVLQCDRLTATAVIHSETNMERLKDRRDRHTSREMYKCIYELNPPSLISVFTYVSDIHERTTRSTNLGLLYVPKSRLEGSKRNFEIRGAMN